uniref:Dicer 2 n=1 Tax=Nilaparvata lugens TaxID=108931 RepID=L7ZCR2_NILLU|nr:Dicer 2 [Nilaparvata lugens]
MDDLDEDLAGLPGDTKEKEEVINDEFVARDYQDELLPLAVQNNCIIYLPTGSGKTFLATMIIKHFGADIEKKLSEGGKRAFFLVNTVQLVEQQAQSIKRQTTFTVGEYTGQTGCDLYSTDPQQEMVAFSPGTHMRSELCTSINIVLDSAIRNVTLFNLKMEEDFVPLKPSIHAIAMEENNKLNKKLANMIVDIKYQMENLGAYGAYKAALAMMILLERKKRSAQLRKHAAAFQYLCTMLTLVRKISFDVLSKYEGEERIIRFVSNKVLKLLELFKGFKETDKALIFVTRRFSCKCLQYILEDLKLPNVKSDFIVGYNTNPFNDTREGLLEKKVNKKVLKRFNGGDTNVLIASDVLEEGIDVQTCNTVIKFDPPTTMRSYIQSKGRARTRQSKFYIMTEAKDYKVEGKINKFERLETKLKHELVGKFLERSLPSEKELANSIFKTTIKPFYPLGPDGPKIEGSTPIALINRYCMSLDCDRFSTLTPFWWKEVSKKNGFNENNIVVYLQLPISSPVRDVIKSDAFPNVELAKRSAALKACKLLYDSRELDDKMLPRGKTSQQLEDRGLFPCWRDEAPPTESDDSAALVRVGPVVKRQTLVGTKKCKSIYNKKFPECMCECRPMPGEKVYMHIIKMKPVYSEPKGNRKKAFFELLKSDSEFAILTTKKWPMTSLIIMKLTHMFELCFQPFELINLAFYLIVFRLFINRLQSFFFTNVLENENGRSVINWSVIRDNQEFPEIISPPVEERQKDIVVTEEIYKNSVVIPWYRGFLPRQAYIVTDLSKNETALSDFPSGDYPTYEKYFVTKYANVEKLYSAQKPLLEVRALSRRLNCLRPRHSVQATSKRKKKQEEEFEESLVPELCVRCAVPAAYWLKATLLPSCVHRITALLLADELRVTIATDLNLSTVTLPPGRSWRPISVDQLCLRDEEEKQQPVLPTAKTVTIKPRRALDLDTNNYPWGTEQEPIDIERAIDQVKLVDIVFYDDFVSKPIVKQKIQSLAQDRQQLEIKALEYASKTVTPHLSIFNSKHEAPGVELADFLQVLTAASAHDIFNLERLETLGDSFLKYAVSLLLFIRFPELSEGQLTMIKGKVIGNRNLFYCGEQKGLGSIIKAVEFNTESDWIAPGFCVDRTVQNLFRELNINPRYLYEIPLSRDEIECGKLSPRTKDIIEEKLEEWEEDLDYCNYSNAHFISQQVISNKTVSDSVEALLGLYIQSYGLEKGFDMLRWLKVIDPKLITPDVYTKKKVEPTILFKGGQIDFHIHHPDYLEKLINYKFKNRAFLLQALSHPTYQPNNITPTYQRLEFLGDAILDFLVTTHMYEYCDNLTPGELTDLRSALVNNVTLASIAVRIGLHKFLLLRSCQLSKVIEAFVERQESRNHDFSDDTLFLIDEIDCNMTRSFSSMRLTATLASPLRYSRPNAIQFIQVKEQCNLFITSFKGPYINIASSE